MACDITTGRARVCKQSLGGQSTLYIYNYDGDDAFTVVDGECTGLDGFNGTVFPFELEGDGNTLEESLVSDRNTSTTVNTQTITTILKQIDAATSANLNFLAYGYPQYVVKDRNGVYSACALDDGADFTVVSTTGGAKSDLNGFTLTGISTTGSLSPKLDSATITAFLALV